MTTLGDRLREEAKLHEDSKKRQYDTLVQSLMKEIPKGKRYITVPYFIDKNIYHRLTKKDKLYVYYVTYDEDENDCMYKNTILSLDKITYVPNGRIIVDP